MATQSLVPIKADIGYRRQRVGVPRAFLMDFIREMIVVTIDDFNLHNLQDSDRFIAVNAADGAERMYDLGQKHIGYDKYSFEDWRWEPMVMEVELDSTCNVWVHAQRGWETLTQWLQEDRIPEKEDDSDVEADSGTWPWSEDQARERQRTLWDKQWRLWTVNGKKFPFCKLPAEIRIAICGFVLGPQHCASPHRYARLGRSGAWKAERGVFPLPSLNILRLNRQFYSEASHILFETTCFRLTSMKDFYRLSDSKTLIKRVQRLELALPHEDFLECFQRLADLGRRGLEYLQVFQFMILKDLVIELAEPKAPARTILRANNNAGWSIGTECGCQKLTVDKILNAALPWIAEQPVRLKGALKNDQKIHFEAKCAAKRREWLDWSATMSMDGQVPTLAEYWEWKAEEDGGVWLDGSGVVVAKSIGEELDGIKDVEAAHENNDELALEKCRCKVMCTPGLWTNED